MEVADDLDDVPLQPQEDVSGDDSEPAEPDDEPFFMPNALTIAGLQHVVNNMMADAHTSLSWWPTFHPQLENFEAFIRIDERRQRYAWSCLHGTPNAHLTSLFARFRGSLYEDRWHEVVSFLRKLKPLLPALARTFDVNRYNRGVDENGTVRPVQAAKQRQQEQNAGIQAFDPKKLAASLRSTLFHKYCGAVLSMEEVPEEIASKAGALATAPLSGTNTCASACWNRIMAKELVLARWRGRRCRSSSQEACTTIARRYGARKRTCCTPRDPTP